MFARALLVLLILCNVALAGLVIRDQTRRAPVISTTVPGVPKLELLSEVNQWTPTPAAPRRSILDNAPRSCFSLGAFGSVGEAERALRRVAAIDADARSRVHQTQVTTSWWVYLPALPSRAEALATAREFSRLGLRDYYVVTTGSEENMISLGVFREEANAQRRLAEIRAAGYPAEIDARTRESPSYYVDFKAEEQPDWASLFVDTPGLQLLPRPCVDSG